MGGGGALAGSAAGPPSGVSRGGGASGPPHGHGHGGREPWAGGARENAGAQGRAPASFVGGAPPPQHPYPTYSGGGGGGAVGRAAVTPAPAENPWHSRGAPAVNSGAGGQAIAPAPAQNPWHRLGGSGKPAQSRMLANSVAKADGGGNGSGGGANDGAAAMWGGRPRPQMVEVGASATFGEVAPAGAEYHLWGGGTDTGAVAMAGATAALESWSGLGGAPPRQRAQHSQPWATSQAAANATSTSTTTTTTTNTNNNNNSDNEPYQLWGKGGMDAPYNDKSTSEVSDEWSAGRRAARADDAHAPYGGSGMSAPPPPPPPPPPPSHGWSGHVSPEGTMYYFNRHSGVSTWERPKELLL